MRIMQVIGSLGNGGAEKLAVELSNELSVNNELFLVSFNSFEKDMVFLNLIKKSVKLFSLKRKQVSLFSFYKKLYFLIRRSKPEIIHLHLDITILYFLPLILCSKFLFSHSVNFHYTIHNNLVIHKSKNSRDTGYNNSRLFDIFNKFKYVPINFICISKLIHSKFSSRYQNIKFSLIQNGTNKLVSSPNSNIVSERISNYKAREDTITLISIGRIASQKNYNLAINAMKKFKREEVILLIIGNEKAKGQPLLSSLSSKSPDNVFFEKTVENVADYLKYSDAFLLTSFYEGMPISVIEAMSFGLPIITTPAGGVVDMVKDGVNGFITSDFEVDSIVRKINNFISLSGKEIEEIRNINSVTFKSEYSMSKCSDRYLKLYEL